MVMVTVHLPCGKLLPKDDFAVEAVEPPLKAEPFCRTSYKFKGQGHM